MSYTLFTLHTRSRNKHRLDEDRSVVRFTNQ